MESVEWHKARTQLEWLLELGVDECIGDAPVDRYALPEKREKQTKPQAMAIPAVIAGSDPVAEAERAAAAAGSLDALRAAMEAFDLCDLKQGARNMVFSDGDPSASVMIIGEAPGRDEDRVGRPFVGEAGKLLDRMLAAIDMGRVHPKSPVYITNTLPWRPPQNREPKQDEIAMMQPFLLRHIDLIAPKVLVLMGNTACQALLGRRGILRLRGQWGEAAGRPALPMCHPAYLFRTPSAKREAWADLLALKARIEGL